MMDIFIKLLYQFSFCVSLEITMLLLTCFQISFSIAKAVASDSLTAIGIFVAGVCPGGGSSNIYTYLLDGDLSLSITMTAISTVMSLGKFHLFKTDGKCAAVQ